MFALSAKEECPRYFVRNTYTVCSLELSANLSVNLTLSQRKSLACDLNQNYSGNYAFIQLYCIFSSCLCLECLEIGGKNQGC